jgi:hypothetical protein
MFVIYWGSGINVFRKIHEACDLYFCCSLRKFLILSVFIQSTGIPKTFLETVAEGEMTDGAVVTADGGFARIKMRDQNFGDDGWDFFFFFITFLWN